MNYFTTSNGSSGSADGDNNRKNARLGVKSARADERSRRLRVAFDEDSAVA